MTEERSDSGDLGTMREVIIAAAIQYRDAMRQYQGEQAEAIGRGTGLDDLVMTNWQSFQEVIRSEERLFALLDSMEVLQARETPEARMPDGALGGG